MNIAQRACMFAYEKHRGQVRDGGGSYYFYHLLPVYHAVAYLTSDLEVHAAAILHDTLEDTDTTYDELVQEFGQRVADLVHEVTHEGNKETGYYFPRLKRKEAILIKLVDRAANIGDMDAWPPERQQHYLKRTKFWKSEEVRS